MKKEHKSQAPEFVDFEFQPIALVDAIRLVAAGGGKYGELGSKLINLLQARKPDQSYVFNLSSGKELPDPVRRGICTSVTSSLKRAGIAFRVTYSSEQKKFVAVPRLKPGAKFATVAQVEKAPQFGRHGRDMGRGATAIAYKAAQVFDVPFEEFRKGSNSPKVIAARHAYILYCRDHKVNNFNAIRFIGGANANDAHKMYAKEKTYYGELEKLTKALANGKQ